MPINKATEDLLSFSYNAYVPFLEEVNLPANVDKSTFDELTKLTSKEVADKLFITSEYQFQILRDNLGKTAQAYNKKVKAYNKSAVQTGWDKFLHIFLRVITFSVSKGLKKTKVNSKEIVSHYDSFGKDMEAIELQNKRNKIYRRAMNCLRKKMLKRVNDDKRVSHIPLLKDKIKEIRLLDLKAKWKSQTQQQAPHANAVIDHARAVANVYKRSGHYVFTHSASMRVSLIFELNKVIMQNYYPGGVGDHRYKAFRIPAIIPESKSVEEFIQKHHVDSNSDHTYAEECMSVDADFENTNSGESARHFFFSNDNILAKHNLLIPKILGNYVKEPELLNAFSDRFIKIGDDKGADSTAGSFYVISVPKEVIQDSKRNFVYRSHAYGRRCSCNHGDTDINVLEKIQNGQLPNTGDQYRIVASLLAKEKSVETVHLHTITQTKKVQYRNLIRQVGLELSINKMIDDYKEIPNVGLMNLMAQKFIMLAELYKSPSNLPFAKDWKPLIVQKFYKVYQAFVDSDQQLDSKFDIPLLYALQPYI